MIKVLMYRLKRILMASLSVIVPFYVFLKKFKTLHVNYSINWPQSKRWNVLYKCNPFALFQYVFILVPKRAITYGHGKNCVMDLSGGKLVLPVVHKRKGIIMETAAERFAQRYANRLKLNVTTINNLKKTARNIMQKELFTGTPKTVGVIMVYLTCHVAQDTSQRRSYEEMSAVSGVSKYSIQKNVNKCFYTEIPPHRCCSRVCLTI
eukprot:90463_1